MLKSGSDFGENLFYLKSELKYSLYFLLGKKMALTIEQQFADIRYNAIAFPLLDETFLHCDEVDVGK